MQIGIESKFVDALKIYQISHAFLERQTYLY